MGKVDKVARNLTENIFFLDDPMFTLYLINADKPTLIDTAILARHQQIEDFIQGLISGKKLEQIVLTHSHYDHCGTLSLLQKKFNSQIYCSAYCAELFNNPKVIEFIDHLNQEFSKLLKAEDRLHFEKPQNVNQLKDGEKIQLGAKQYLVAFSTPGHTRCSFSYLLYPEMVLFPGDAAGVMEKDGTIRPLFLSSYKLYIDSLQKLEKLPAEYLALPHNKPLRGREAIRDFFDRSIDTTIELKERVLKELQRQEYKIEVIAERLFQEFYSQSTLSGPKEAFIINLQAMVKAVSNEFLA